MTTSPTTALAVPTPAWTAGIYGQLDAARTVAEMLAKSEMVPKGFQNKPADIIIAGAMGARLGLDLFSSLAGIAVVNGRATLWGDALLAVCMAHSEYEDCIEVTTGKPYEDDFTAVCTVQRKGRAPKVCTFSVIESKEANLWKKAGPWTTAPQRMLAMRARAFALRGAFADALAGFHAREEMEDVEPIDVTPSVTVHAEPKPAKRRTIEATAAAVVDAAQVDTAQATTAPEPVDAKPKDTSVAVCVLEFAKLWRHSDAGKVAAKAIQEKWKFKAVQELAGSADCDRESFLAEVAAAAVAAAKTEG